MSYSENFKALVTDLSEYLATELTIEDNRVFFNLDEDMGGVLFFEEDIENNAAILATSIVIGVPDPNDSDFLYDVLCGNYMGAKTADGTLSIEENTKALVNTLILRFPIDSSEYITKLSYLVGASRVWKHRLDVSTESDDSMASNLNMLEI